MKFYILLLFLLFNITGCTVQPDDLTAKEEIYTETEPENYT